MADSLLIACDTSGLNIMGGFYQKHKVLLQIIFTEFITENFKRDECIKR